ncbi:hypothetical protein [Sinosporangium siamense]|uniref:Uncharacterized protein n=1 Tax=Sinosporangium siamense TaxID=1367973 RepID=A0A919RDK6_9ACTN|nr:hypothetical protein [Sinosporangium siamense]GII91956.1 hypothetical protein Ssi02_21870 [Sinosporangium siamense]
MNAVTDLFTEVRPVLANAGLYPVLREGPPRLVGVDEHGWERIIVEGPADEFDRYTAEIPARGILLPLTVEQIADALRPSNWGG